MRVLVCLFMTVVGVHSACAVAAPTLYTNLNGYTLTPEGTLHRFKHMLVEDGKVVSLPVQLDALPPDTLTLDMQGQTVLPGLTDAHGHLLGLGANLLQVDLRDLPSAQASAIKVAEYATKNPNLPWLTGRGWNQVLWEDDRFPTARQLDEHVKDRPVWLERVDGHAGWANSKALEMAGISKDTLDPPGGKIVRDDRGNPTGVLIDNAMPLLEKHLPSAGDAFLLASLEAAGQHLLSQGVTGMHDAGIPFDVYRFYRVQSKQGTLPVRVYAMLAATDLRLPFMLKAGHIEDDKDMLSIRSVKAYGDGALGSRGAALISPYNDAPHNRGLLVTRKVDLKPLFDRVLSSGFQLNFHAIGDRANQLALDQFADSFARIGGMPLRNRIEHAQVIGLDDIERFATLNIIASVQPTHATSDMNMAEDRIGSQRILGAYAWRRLLNAGARLALGSDFPVELANPFFGLHAAVTRQDRDNAPKQGWYPDQALTLTEALRGFTLDAAYAAHQEEVLGTLTAGKWADFIVVDRDLFAGAKEDIWRTQVLQTYIAGERVYQREL